MRAELPAPVKKDRTRCTMSGLAESAGAAKVSAGQRRGKTSAPVLVGYPRMPAGGETYPAV